MTDPSARRESLRRLLADEAAPTLLVTSGSNVTYLTGFTGDSSYLLVDPAGAVLVSDPRFTEQIADECPGLDVAIRPSSSVPMRTAVADVVAARGLARVGVERSLTLGVRDDLLRGFADAKRACELVPLPPLVEKLRTIKDEAEIAEIRRAVRLAEAAFTSVTALLRRDLSERMIAADLEHAIRRLGGVGCAFPAIVAAGPRSSLPHARATDRKVGDDQLLLIDWGAQATLYRSDLTRTIALTDRLDDRLARAWDTVAKAKDAAIAAIRPGALCKDVDQVARRIIDDAGFAGLFGHGLGHAIGLDVHESARFSPISEDVLAPGMVLTVEPGVYQPGLGGIRLEEDVLVTEDGCEVLSSLPSDRASMTRRID